MITNEKAGKQLPLETWKSSVLLTVSSQLSRLEISVGQEQEVGHTLAECVCVFPHPLTYNTAS